MPLNSKPHYEILDGMRGGRSHFGIGQPLVRNGLPSLL